MIIFCDNRENVEARADCARGQVCLWISDLIVIATKENLGHWARYDGPALWQEIGLFDLKVSQTQLGRSVPNILSKGGMYMLQAILQ